MLRSWGTAFVLSIAAHLTVVGAVVGLLVVGGLSLSVPIDVEIAGMRLDEVHDLPLGPPPGAADRLSPPGPPRARRRAPKPPASQGELAGQDPAPDERPGASELDPAAPRATSLRQYGPEGSRVTVLLRLDRLRDTSYAPALDAILGRLPDRHDLLDGTGLDLFQSFDALLIATPNPLDYAVTFLAARHRLKETELRAALDRGAKATNRVLTWRTEGHRPFAERHARTPGRGAASSRDERLVVLPAPGLVVVTPPIYRSLLLAAPGARAHVTPDAGPDAGGDASGNGRGGDGARASPDGGGVAAGSAEAQWGALLRRIDAEDGIMPPTAVAMVSAVDLFSARGLARGLAVAPSGGPGGAGGPGGSGGSGTIAGMEVPKVLTASIGVTPSPFLDVVAEFEDEEQARHWESAWPSKHQQLKTNPYVILSGFGPLVARAELSRVASTITLHQIATEAETLRLLQLAVRLLGVEPIAAP